MSKLDLLVRSLSGHALRNLIGLRRPFDEDARLPAHTAFTLDQVLPDDTRLLRDRRTMLDLMPKDAVVAVDKFAMQTRSPFRFLTNQPDKHDSFAPVLNA